MRFEHGDTTYLGEGWAGFSELVSWDEDFPFGELSESDLTRLYEAGRWWSDSGVRERPGVRGFLGRIEVGERPYLLVQDLRSGNCEVRLEDYLLRDAPSSERGARFVMVETGHKTFELWYGGDTFAQDNALLLCERAHEWVEIKRLEAGRFPPLLLEVARGARSILLRDLVEVSRGQSSGGTGVRIHRVSGEEEVYVVARRPESFLNPLGLQIEPGGGSLSSGFHSLGLGGEGSRDAEMLAYLVVFSELLGDEAPIMRYHEHVKFNAGLDALSGVVSGEFFPVPGRGDGAFLFSATPEITSRVMGLVRESLRGRKSGGFGPGTTKPPHYFSDGTR